MSSVVRSTPRQFHEPGTVHRFVEVLVNLRDYLLDLRGSSSFCDGNEEDGDCPFQQLADTHQVGVWSVETERIAALEEAIGRADAFDLLSHLARQRAFSERTFGPGNRTAGVVDHIRKELAEIESAGSPGERLKEYIDVAILAFDGMWREGFTPDQIIAALVAKQDKNERRSWPDWRTAPTDRAIEHIPEGVEA